MLLVSLVACSGPGYAGRSPRSGTLRYEPGGSFRHSRALSPEEAAHWKAVEARLEEYLQWGMLLMETHASHLRRIAPGHLLTEHPLREKSLDALVRATLAWAYSHTQDPDFLRRSPSEVALYLLASRSSLATAIELGKQAPPHLDYSPPPADSYTQEELVAELAIGLTPVVGDVSDLAAALSGQSITGHPLSDTERLIHVLGVVLPFANGKLLKEGGETALERVALVTGRSLHEVRVLSRVASQLSAQDVKEIERILQRAADRGGTLADEELAFLRKVAGKLEKPLDEATAALRRGQKPPLLGARALPTGARMLPGSAEHLAQCWVDYQFRHPLKYRRFSYAVDPEWERLYRSILANKPAGSAFEDSILKAASFEKNTALMLPPPGSQAVGFIPDSVRGNPGELLWGQPYHFVEAKGRQELALTGNLKAMIDYVSKYGGHIELWIRSAGHPAGKTRLTNPLQQDLRALIQDGRAAIKYFP
ncbi:pre-toxin TG domain-containing protein [Archangium lipolyticum]|uniref:pre-toxin TG domain-containing protein n=1 Tax=Archangium lipolyticum TaxID=2970465 RepID=UPI00214A3935|nr:pre-toxin TG domain-containing protein [Archangium lipolyticum]